VADVPVLIVSLTTCGHCAQAKEFFLRRGVNPTVIEFDTVGVDLKRRIAADMRAHKVRGFPFVMIGGKAVEGYDPEAFERLLSMN
jgi:glutaredoxin